MSIRLRPFGVPILEDSGERDSFIAIATVMKRSTHVA